MQNFTQLLQQPTFILFLLFCTCTVVLLFYYCFYFGRLAFYKKSTRLSSHTHPVSVIVCARDEAENLSINLPGILVQEYRSSHEVIVVDDNSYDDSKYLLEALQKQFRQLQVVNLTQEAKMIQGKKFPLSIGIKTAKHEIVLLTDADCMPATEHWIQSMQEAYSEGKEIILGYGPYQKKTGFLNKLIRWETFHTALQYFSYALAGKAYMGVGRNLSYKKTIFFRHKGFSAHSNIPGGDDDLFINMAATKKNVGINLDKESFTISKPPANWAAWVKQKTRHYSTGKFYKAGHKFSLGLYAICQSSFYVLALLSCIFFDWKITLPVLAGKLIIQGIIFYKTMKKLGEEDLFPYFFLLDMGMLLYYLRFSFTLFKKPGDHWK